MAIVLLIVGGIVAGLAWGVHTLIRGVLDSPPVTMALAMLSADAETADQLGLPLSAAGLTSGSLNYENTGGRALINFTVQGQRAQAWAEVRATRHGGVWTIDELRLERPDGDTVIWRGQLPPRRLTPRDSAI